MGRFCPFYNLRHVVLLDRVGAVVEACRPCPHPGSPCCSLQNGEERSRVGMSATRCMVEHARAFQQQDSRCSAVHDFFGCLVTAQVLGSVSGLGKRRSTNKGPRTLLLLGFSEIAIPHPFGVCRISLVCHTNDTSRCDSSRNESGESGVRCRSYESES